MTPNLTMIHGPGDLVVVNCAAGGKQIAMVSHWIDCERVSAWKFRAASKKWTVKKTLKAAWVVGSIDEHAKDGPMKKALTACRKAGFPE